MSRTPSHTPHHHTPPPHEGAAPGPWRSPALLPVLFACTVAVAFSLWQGSRLPERVASHFNAAGLADGFMAREHFVIVQIVLSGVLPLLVWWGLMVAAGKGRMNMPHARDWLAPPHRTRTLRFLAWHGAVLSVSLVAFLSLVFAGVARANAATVPRLQGGGTLLSTLGYLGFIGLWVVVLYRRFGRRPADAVQPAAGSWRK